LRIRWTLTLERGLDSIDDAYLAGLESALQQRPRDPLLQYLVGMACLHRQLWGKAQLLLSQAVGQLGEASVRRRAWRALARLAEQRGDTEAAGQAYRKIADL
jgi:HemY protein